MIMQIAEFCIENSLNERTENGKMKKVIVILGVIALLLGTVTVYALGDNISAAVSDDGTAERAEIAQSVALPLSSGEQLSVTYDISRSVSGGFADIYKDASGNDWIYKNGTLTGFYNNGIDCPAADSEPIGTDAAVRIAMAFLVNFTESADEYSVKDITENVNYGQYYITFAKKIGGVFTDETADVWVMYDGGIKSVSVHENGSYTDIREDDVSDITPGMLEGYAGDELELIYPGENVSFEMENYTLKKDADGYYIQIYGVLTRQGAAGGCEKTEEFVRYSLEN